MFRSLTLLAAALLSLSAPSLGADDAVLGQMYGSGVHAYFSRDYVRAYEYLTAAIDGGSTDPRCYYFRGLAYMRLGREPEAEMDFAKGADFESRDVDGTYAVARSLGRIQGGTRLLIERYRVKARLAALKHAEEVHKARYEATRAEEPRVVRSPIETVPVAPGETSAKPGVQPAPKPAPEPVPEDVFESGPPQPAQPEKTAVGPPKPPVSPPATGKKEVIAPAPEPTPKQPPESPFESPPAGKKPVIEPAPGPPGGPVKSGGILGEFGKALGKAVTTGDWQLPGLPIGAGMPPDEGSSDPFQVEPKIGPPPKTSPLTPPAPAPKATPVTPPQVPPAAPPKAPPLTPPQVPPATPPKVPPATLPKAPSETLDDPFDDQPSGKPSPEPVAEPPANSPGGPPAKPGPEPPAEPGGEPATEPGAEPAAAPSPEPPGSDPFGG
jgi:hypothetical protein